MAITNGALIAAADLTAATNASRATIRTDNAQLPLGWHFNAYFHGLLAATPRERSRCIFVAPFDCTVESVAVTALGFDALSVLTVDVTAPGVLASFPLRVFALASTANLPRILYDGTKGKTGAMMPANPAVRALYAGTRCTIAVSTQVNVGAAAFLHVDVALRQYFARSNT